ncbi:MAG: oligosaccharide flippase family protein [Novosphingobium sp.]
MTSTPAPGLGRAPFDARGVLQRLAAVARHDTNIVVAFIILTNLLRTGSSMVLTRLLVPEVFGIAALIGSIQFTINMISDLGFEPFVVRHPDGDKRRFLDSIWTVALIRSIAIAVVLVALATPLAHLFDKPDLAAMIAVSSLSFVIDGLASMTLLTALRQRQILRLSSIEFAVMVVQIVVTAILAYFWRSYWAIQVGLLVGCALKTVLSYTMFAQSARKLAFDRGYAGDLWAFARFITGSSIISLLLVQTDKLVLARLMSLDTFGLYILACNLAGAPLAFASAYASRVLYPTYSQLWRDGAGNLREQAYAKRWLPSLLYTFAAGGLIGSAPLVIAVLYDPRYANAALYLQVLGIGTLFALAGTSSNATLTAIGRIKATLEANIVKLIWMTLAAPAGYALYGEIGLVAAVGMMEIPAVLFRWWQMHRAALLDLRQELLFLAAGAAGLAMGTAGDVLIRPFVP